MNSISSYDRSAFAVRLMRAVVVTALVVVTSALAVLCFYLRFNLSTAGSIELFLVVLVALRWDFLEATAVSLASVVCLNYLFTQPLFQFSVADPENWVSLITFEITALLVSRLSSKARRYAAEADVEKKRNAKLYELSRAILLIDGRSAPGEQIAALIREIVEVEDVDIWLVYADTTDTYSKASTLPMSSPKSTAHIAFLQGRDEDDLDARTTRRIVRIGTTPIGAMVLRKWATDPLLADAVASLVALAVERARAVQKENRAEAERNTEQLRTAVLDGLAHGFKTPLTAIQTASSGLLEIKELNPVQTELVTIIDEQATVLAKLTTRLLHTATLESRKVRIQRTNVSLVSLVRYVIEQHDPELRLRIHLLSSEGVEKVWLDAQLIELVITQLVDNALKYSPVSGLVEISISQDEKETTLIVANEGSSIHPEERERIFERFYRGQASVHGPSGSGLGLSIVKKAIDSHGGRVWVEMVNNQTQFSITIPREESRRDG